MTYQFHPQIEPFKFYSEFDNEGEAWSNDSEAWQQEVSGKNPDRYVVWLQQSLNKVVKLRVPLVEDGDFGTNTRNALLMFRRQAKLKSTGDLVCPDTENKLAAAAANPAPGPLVARPAETTPPGLTLYADIPLQVPLGSAKSMTGVFIPENYCLLPQVDLLVFFHGNKVRVHKPHFSVDSFWSLPTFLLREEVNKSQKNVILVAPTLGPFNQPGSLVCAGGFDRFLDHVMVSLKQFGPYGGTNQPTVGNIILACHSGSGGVMRSIATGTDVAATKIQECWAFEPSGSIGSANQWKTWVQSRTTASLYVYHLGGTAGENFCNNLDRQLRGSKVVCTPVDPKLVFHDAVPMRFLKDRLQGASFLALKSSCTASPTAIPGKTSFLRKRWPFGKTPLSFSREFNGPREFWNNEREASREKYDFNRGRPEFRLEGETAEAINEALKINPKGGYVRGSTARKKLDDAISSVPGTCAAQLHAQLKTGQDPIGKLFRHRLHPTTQSVLLAILANKDQAFQKSFQTTTPTPLPSTTCQLFLPAKAGSYEDYVAAQTTGRITLFINGRNSGGAGPDDNVDEAFDRMQEAVEALQPGDTVYLAAWHFDPTVPLTGPSTIATWGELIKEKANDGVKIRIIMTDFAPIATFLHAKLYNDFLPTLNNLISQLPTAKRDNLKYIVSRHPATQFSIHVATHHQKFMVLKKRGATTAFCGGLDIAYMRTPAYWTAAGYPWLWHDLHSKLEGRIARDLESEFVLRWNREKSASVVGTVSGWKPLETLVQGAANPVDLRADNNRQKLQMLRTVSVQGPGLQIQTTRRDDIWQGYLRLIGCATRIIYMENQYFREPRMADAIVQQAKAQPGLIVIIVVPEQLDDPNDAIKRHGNWLQYNFFLRLFAGIPPKRRRVYTMFHRIIHSKLMMADDHLLTIGSANANPRGFFMDTELNVMLDHADTVTSFRHRLWAHNLGVSQSTVAGWNVADFIPRWDATAKTNSGLKATPDEVLGEGVIPFDPVCTTSQQQGVISDVLTEVNDFGMREGLGQRPLAPFRVRRHRLIG